jgi:N-acyl-D-aspartate/D-glutamate deacylase
MVGEWIVLRGKSPETRQYDETKIRDVAAAMGKDAIDAFCDIALADELQTVFYLQLSNQNPVYTRELVQDPYIVPGTSDGGAHTKYLTTGRYPTEYLIDFVRDHAWVTLEEAHHRLSALPANCVGFQNRGILREGAAADIVVYDYKNLEILPEEINYDYPAGEWRRVRRASGYRFILVNGEVVIEEDKEVGGVSSGRLLTHGGE